MATSIEHKAYEIAQLAKSLRNAIARLATLKLNVYTRVAKEEALEFGGLQADI